MSPWKRTKWLKILLVTFFGTLCRWFESIKSLKFAFVIDNLFFSCFVSPQASWQPTWLLWQDVWGVREGIFGQWWAVTREDNYKIFSQQRFGSVLTSFTAWPAKDLTRWRSRWPTTMAGAMWRYMTSSRLYQIKFINICHFENLIVIRAEKIVFWSPHRSVQGTILSSRLLGSTPPSQPSGTPWHVTMGWSSVPSKSNFDTIGKSSEWN